MKRELSSIYAALVHDTVMSLILSLVATYFAVEIWVNLVSGHGAIATLHLIMVGTLEALIIMMLGMTAIRKIRLLISPRHTCDQIPPYS